MKKILLDINILIDLFSRREDHESAAKIFDLCITDKVQGYLCSHEITTLSYFMERDKYLKTKRHYILTTLLDSFSILPATEKILKEAMNSPIDDFEDAVIEVPARLESLDGIVTRNQKDFKKGEILCYTASEVLAVLKR
ncbi:MAG: PIN domain-containing protein [Candidatus Marinimicrobia bacterium]|nr:PIN domain-containing protein [Candidatus Neomarinimicrobiota bacterium]